MKRVPTEIVGAEDNEKGSAGDRRSG